MKTRNNGMHLSYHREKFVAVGSHVNVVKFQQNRCVSRSTRCYVSGNLISARHACNVGFPVVVMNEYQPD